jgi:hypothetical protein
MFDLAGTLVDTVYAHVFAWQRALAEAGMPIDGWRIHRRIGMSGGLFTRPDNVRRRVSPQTRAQVTRSHDLPGPLAVRLPVAHRVATSTPPQRPQESSFDVRQVSFA